MTPRNSRTHIGGVEKHVRILTKELEKRGHRVSEFSLDGRERKGGGKLRAWRYLWERRHQLRRADVIHIHDVFWWYIPFRLLFPTKRVYTTFHGWEGKYPPSTGAVFQKKLAQRFCYGTVGIGKFFLHWYGVSPTKVTYGALDEITLQRAKQLGPPTRIRTLAFFGRLEPVNDIAIVLSALAELKKTGYSVMFIGDGSARTRAEKIGPVTGLVHSPVHFVMSSDAVIACSYLSILESFALARPVISIATNPLKRDYLSTHPLSRYFPICSSTAEVIEHVRRLAVSRSRERIFAGQNWARKQTPEKLADLYESLWNQ